MCGGIKNEDYRKWKKKNGKIQRKEYNVKKQKKRKNKSEKLIMDHWEREKRKYINNTILQFSRTDNW